MIGKTIEEGEKIWQKGNRTIWQVTMSIDGGQSEIYKTYSKAIAAEGFEGEVELYSRTNFQGKDEKFVKQPLDKGSQKQFGQASLGEPAGRTNFEMYLAYAKDIAVALIETSGLTPEAYAKALKAVSRGAVTLYEARPDGSKPALALDLDKLVKASTQPAEGSKDDLTKIFGDDLEAIVDPNEPLPERSK